VERQKREEADKMREQIAVAALCLIIGVGALGAAAWALITGQIGRQGLDALFLILVCLLIAVMFLPFPVQLLRQGKWRELLKREKSKAAEETAPAPAQKTPEGS
jgi:uncharacterized membrane protein YfcA